MQTIIAKQTGPREMTSVHDPDGVSVWAVDWSAFLADVDGAGTTGTMTGSSWIITGDATEASSDSGVLAANKNRIQLSGGTDGETLTVTNRITYTVSGFAGTLTEDRSMLIDVAHR